LIAFGAECGREINPREAGVLLLTHVTEDRDAGWKTVAPFLRNLPMAPEDLANRCLVGPAQECVSKIADFVEAGCSKFVLRPSCPPADVIGQIELYANQILPHFN